MFNCALETVEVSSVSITMLVTAAKSVETLVLNSVDLAEI